MRRLTLQWRITLLTAALVLVTCAVLSLAIGRFALLRFDEVGRWSIEITPFGDESATLGFDLSQIAPQISHQLEEAKAALILQSAALTVVVALCAIVATYFLAGRTLRPLRRIASRMTQIEAQNLSEPLEQPEREDEISEMIHSFNGMLTRLEGAFAAQRQFSASAAHELRTPLAVMRTKLEVLQRTGGTVRPDDLTRTFGEQIDRLAHLVELLLEMTELQAVERSDRVELHALADEVLCDLAEVAAKRGVSLSQSPERCTVPGSDTLLYRAIYNLVENGIKHGGPHGAVHIEVRAEVVTAVVSISDRGGGVDRAKWDALFTPFFRVDSGRPRRMGGAGLGLALVKEIAEVHRGVVRVARSSPAGTTVELTLPRPAGDAEVTR
ncbi:HAMP domain-containing protein [Pseudactinotalea sp. HY160]|uniref:sensor histidine kinase n=1 Tax=Pseudactinotalea sp. HY160 TaxID=2654490 RepID=UPI00128B372D|nr:HAMP domain-containing sensor histidine kinase [Pseudactinotalea sp. HY160]MPV49109.1 HAMP domain-containing protein [Pseudactinotalea sp. HY160]